MTLYQNGGTTKNGGANNNNGGGGGASVRLSSKSNEMSALLRDPHLHPIDYLQSRKLERTYLLIFLSLLLVILTTALAVWKLRMYHANQEAAERAFEPKAALDRLNFHVNKQSQRIHYQCESTLLVIRHCEKHGPYVADTDGNQHCSYMGYERAKFLSTLFGTDTASRWPVPQHLYALNPDRDYHYNFREWETIHPLSQKANVAIQIVNDGTSFAQEYFALLQSGALCGQVSVISWKHEMLPQLAISLACGYENGCPDTWDEDDYDTVWQLKYVFHPAKEGVYETDEKTMYHSSNKTSTSSATTKSVILTDDDATDDDTPAVNDDDNSYSSTHIRKQKRHKSKVSSSSTSDSSTGSSENGSTRRLETQDSFDMTTSDKESSSQEEPQQQRRRQEMLEMLLQQQEQRHRQLGHHFTGMSRHGWNVYATVVKQNFDPLSFSKQAGDYPDTGASSGGRWGPGGDL